MFFYLSTQKAATTLFIHFFKISRPLAVHPGHHYAWCSRPRLGQCHDARDRCANRCLLPGKTLCWGEDSTEVRQLRVRTTARALTVCASLSKLLNFFRSLSQKTVVVKYYNLFNGVALTMKWGKVGTMLNLLPGTQ